MLYNKTKNLWLLKLAQIIFTFFFSMGNPHQFVVNGQKL